MAGPDSWTDMILIGVTFAGARSGKAKAVC
jgi:hypothetical protein